MYAGLANAQKILSDSKHSGKMKRIFLFSDGLVNRYM